MSGEFDSYHATYCESCGRIKNASEEILESVDEPVHRLDIIEAIGQVENVSETVAQELGGCECTGQIVKRYYAHPAGNVPEPDYEPDPDEFSGRDPEEDALIDMREVGEGIKEVSELPWLTENSREKDTESSEEATDD